MPEVPSSVLALFDVGVSLMRRTASGRVWLARHADVLHADLLPEALRGPLRAELEGAHMTLVEPIDAKLAQKAANGVKGVDETPLATTPTAQVHRGELNGEPVAVKVARPGLAATIRSELSLLDILAGPIRAVFPVLDVPGVLREVREAVMDELDLEHEGETQHRVRRALRRLDGVTVPAVHVDECGPEVLVTELLEGPTLAAARAPDPGRVARLLVEAHLTAWGEAGLVLTDARPGHIVLLPNDSIGLLGTGLARPVARDRMAIGVSAFAGLAEADPAHFVAAAEALGVLPADAAAEAHALLRELLGEFATGPARLDGPALAAMTVRAHRRIGDLLRLGAQATPEPSDLAALRMLGQLTAALSRLGVTEDWPALALTASAAS